MTTLTIGQLLSLIDRARHAVDEGWGGAAASLTADLMNVQTLLEQVIGASHMGCARDEVLIRVNAAEDIVEAYRVTAPAQPAPADGSEPDPTTGNPALDRAISDYRKVQAQLPEGPTAQAVLVLAARIDELQDFFDRALPEAGWGR